MNGSLALSNGVLHLGRHARAGEVRTYDLDGARIGEGFRFGGRDGGAASVDGLAVDADLRILVADRVACAVRSFSVFGVELECAIGVASSSRVPRGSDDDAAGRLGQPASVSVSGVELETRVVVASRGRRRHALQVFDASGAWIESLRPRGDPQGSFGDLVRVAQQGNRIVACERAAGLIQVFRGHEFHYALRVPTARAGVEVELRAAAPLADGRMVVAVGGEGTSAVMVIDANGRRLSTIAASGVDAGAVNEPTDVVVAEGDADRRTRVFVVDSDGDRVQVFTLTGVCYGSFADLPRS